MKSNIMNLQIKKMNLKYRKELKDMTKEDVKRLDAIVDGASKLPVENQEYILTTIKGMLFTRNLLLKQAEQPRKPPKNCTHST